VLSLPTYLVFKLQRQALSSHSPSKLNPRAKVARLEATCSRWVVFVTFVLFAKKYVCHGTRSQWVLAISADCGYVNSSVAPNPDSHSPYFREDETIVFTLG
jgi:hypothetical protein